MNEKENVGEHLIGLFLEETYDFGPIKREIEKESECYCLFLFFRILVKNIEGKEKESIKNNVYTRNPKERLFPPKPLQITNLICFLNKTRINHKKE